MVKHVKGENLSKHRTHLANERTLLAYLRTSLAFLALGTLIMKFLSQEYFMIGVISIIFGLGLTLYGGIKFINNKKKIEHI